MLNDDNNNSTAQESRASYSSAFNAEVAQHLIKLVSDRYNSNQDWKADGQTPDSLRYLAQLLLQANLDKKDQQAGYLLSCVAEEMAGINGEAWQWELDDIIRHIYQEVER